MRIKEAKQPHERGWILSKCAALAGSFCRPAHDTPLSGPVGQLAGIKMDLPGLPHSYPPSAPIPPHRHVKGTYRHIKGIFPQGPSPQWESVDGGQGKQAGASPGPWRTRICSHSARRRPPFMFRPTCGLDSVLCGGRWPWGAAGAFPLQERGLQNFAVAAAPL